MGPNEFNVRRSTVDRILESQAELMRTTRIMPVEQGGRTVGVQLYGVRGNSLQIVEYTWNRINNSKAYNACSNMPRMAHFNLLTEQQIKDVMALLLDPASPVNK